MKRILVVDESRPVRETLALILSRDFMVIQRSISDEDPFPVQERIDLVILGLSSEWSQDPTAALRIASDLSSPVLVLADSMLLAPLKRSKRKLECLAKPFNPYELKEKVQALLERPNLPESAEAPLVPSSDLDGGTAFLQFPYLSQRNVALAQKFALGRLPILIHAEAGCGQERVAKAMHQVGNRNGLWLSIVSREFNEEVLLREIQAFSDMGRPNASWCVTLFLEAVETLDQGLQSRILRFLEREEELGRDMWVISSTHVDLLKEVYARRYPDLLFYRLTPLTLRIEPLRDRVEDLRALATRVATDYAGRLGLSENITLSEGALDRLQNYLWFGNLAEMERVLAQTLAVWRKANIEAAELLFDFGDRNAPAVPAGAFARDGRWSALGIESGKSPTRDNKIEVLGGFHNGGAPDLKVLIQELAHEFKNPMVTIKTFAQLLQKRFDDPEFRTRYQDRVNRDIEKMNDLLEVLLEFGLFGDPVRNRILVEQQLHLVMQEKLPSWFNKEAKIYVDVKSEGVTALIDEAQFRYAVRNVLVAALNQVKGGDEVKVEIEEGGGIVVSYAPEGGLRYPSLDDLESQQNTGSENLSLRVILAKVLLQKNGGDLQLTSFDEGRVQVRIGLLKA